MNKILLAVVVVAVGVAAGWYYFKGTAGVSPSSVIPVPTVAETTPVVTAVGSTTVSYTDTGFNPKTITVKKDTTVTFKNNSSSKMWVASDAHPTHQLLPGFDELTGVVKSGTYTYTFVKVGTWQYHNHLNPTDVGIVVVTVK